MDPITLPFTHATPTMTAFLNLLRWFFGISLILAGLGGFGKGEVLPALFSIAIGAVILPPVWNLLFGKKSESGGTSETVTPEKAVTSTTASSSQSEFMTGLQEKLSDRRLSPQEETELLETAKKLGYEGVSLDKLVSQATLRDMARSKLMWRFEQGVFDGIPDLPLALRKYETCFLGLPGALIEQETKTVATKHRGADLSFRIAKGITYRVGSAVSQPIQITQRFRHAGSLFLTTYRVIFSSGKNSFQVTFNKLLTFEVYSDAIGLVVDGWEYYVALDKAEVELFAVGLASALRNYNDEDPAKRDQALADIEQHASLINVTFQK